MNHKNAIYCLTASAFVICALFVVQLEGKYTSSAFAGNVVTNDQATFLTAKIAQGDDGMFEIDNNTGQMLLYRYDEDLERVRLLASRDLRSLFSSNSKNNNKDRQRQRKRVRER